MKVSDLQGAELDFWVAKAIGWTEGRLGTQDRNDPEPRGWYGKGAGQYGIKRAYFNPSTNWAQGGPLIEKYITDIHKYGEYKMTLYKNKPSGKWNAKIYSKNIVAYGPTPLIAAMRAIVTSVYGGNVDE